MLGSILTVSKKTASAARAAVGSVKGGSKKVRESAVLLANELLATTQGPLTSAPWERREWSFCRPSHVPDAVLERSKEHQGLR